MNTVGMDLVTDFRTALRRSPVFSVSSECARVYSESTLVNKCESDKGHNFMTLVRKANVKVGGSDLYSVPVFGAFCTGKYSYIWNSGYFFSNEYKVENGTLNKASLKYIDTSGVTKTESDIRLAKIEDSERAVCISVMGNNYVPGLSNFDSKFDITSYGSVGGELVELLGTGNGSNLSLYNLESTLPAESNDGKNVFYNASFVLGTISGGVNLSSTSNYCAVPEGYSSVENFDYCAINKFNFAAQANGG